MKGIRCDSMKKQYASIWAANARFLLTLGLLLGPTALLANHGLEAVGTVVTFATGIIGAVCLIPTLVFLVRKKPAPWARYVLLVLNFGLGVLFFRTAKELDEVIFISVAVTLIVAGILVAIKTIRNQ